MGTGGISLETPMNAAARILDRLQVVKPSGPGQWICTCPAHEDRSPSLSIRELDDGRVLVHDFGGCSTESVLAALGLELRDLFDDRPAQHYAPPSKARIPTRDLLVLIDHEITIAMLIATELLEGRTITDADWQRLAQAVARIHKARDHAAPAQVKIK